MLQSWRRRRKYHSQSRRFGTLGVNGCVYGLRSYFNIISLIDTGILINTWFLDLPARIMNLSCASTRLSNRTVGGTPPSYSTIWSKRRFRATFLRFATFHRCRRELLLIRAPSAEWHLLYLVASSAFFWRHNILSLTSWSNPGVIPVRVVNMHANWSLSVFLDHVSKTFV